MCHRCRCVRYNRSSYWLSLDNGHAHGDTDGRRITHSCSNDADSGSLTNPSGDISDGGGYNRTSSFTDHCSGSSDTDKTGGFAYNRCAGSYGYKACGSAHYTTRGWGSARHSA